MSDYAVTLHNDGSFDVYDWFGKSVDDHDKLTDAAKRTWALGMMSRIDSYLHQQRFVAGPGDPEAWDGVENSQSRLMCRRCLGTGQSAAAGVFGVCPMCNGSGDAT